MSCLTLAMDLLGPVGGGLGSSGVGLVRMHALDVRSEWDLGCLETVSVSLPLGRVPQAILEQLLCCGAVHWPTAAGCCPWGVSWYVHA